MVSAVNLVQVSASVQNAATKYHALEDRNVANAASVALKCIADSFRKWECKAGFLNGGLFCFQGN